MIKSRLFSHTELQTLIYEVEEEAIQREAQQDEQKITAWISNPTLTPDAALRRFGPARYLPASQQLRGN